MKPYDVTRPGPRVADAIAVILRMSTRADVRRAVTGPSGQENSPTDHWLLRAIVERGTVRMSDLAAWQGVDKSTITPQVRRLEVRGLVERQVDPGDRRVSLLSATEQGRTVVTTAQEAGASFFDAVLAEWSELDRETLATLLGRFAAGLEAQPLRRPRP